MVVYVYEHVNVVYISLTVIDKWQHSYFDNITRTILLLISATYNCLC